MTGEKITEQNKDMRVLITYKGSAEIGKEFQDDYMILELVTDGRPDALASAVVRAFLSMTSFLMNQWRQRNLC